MNGANRWSGCSVCARPDVAEVNAAIVGGGTVRALASQYGIAKSTLDLHKRRCGVAKAPKPPKAAATLPAVDVAVKAATSEISGFEARTPEAKTLLPIVQDSIAMYWECRDANDIRSSINTLPEIRNGIGKLYVVNEVKEKPVDSAAAYFKHPLHDEMCSVIRGAVPDEITQRAIGAALLAWERSHMEDA